MMLLAGKVTTSSPGLMSSVQLVHSEPTVVTHWEYRALGAKAKGRVMRT